MFLLDFNQYNYGQYEIYGRVNLETIVNNKFEEKIIHFTILTNISSVKPNNSSDLGYAGKDYFPGKFTSNEQFSIYNTEVVPHIIYCKDNKKDIDSISDNCY